MAEQISANRSLLEQIKAEIEADLPVYAECGGSVISGEKYSDRRLNPIRWWVCLTVMWK